VCTIVTEFNKTLEKKKIKIKIKILESLIKHNLQSVVDLKDVNLITVTEV